MAVNVHKLGTMPYWKNALISGVRAAAFPMYMVKIIRFLLNDFVQYFSVGLFIYLRIYIWQLWPIDCVPSDECFRDTVKSAGLDYRARFIPRARKDYRLEWQNRASCPLTQRFLAGVFEMDEKEMIRLYGNHNEALTELMKWTRNGQPFRRASGMALDDFGHRLVRQA